MTMRCGAGREFALVLGGLILAAAALLLGLLDPRAALSGWLAAAACVAALPAGALLLRLTMVLVSGKWIEDFAEPARLLGALWPLGAAAFAPVLMGMAAIYPWYGAKPHSPFAGLWLAPVFFALRTISWFALGGFAAPRASRGLSEGAAAAMLIAIVFAANFVFADWLMTLDPEFASSGFGLMLIVSSACAALAAMILLRIWAGPVLHPGVAGGLLLTLLLLWAYFQFMPFLIVWSGNLPASVAWYAARSTPGAVSALTLASVLGGAPLFALLAPQVRKSTPCLGWCSVSVLSGKAIEFGWLALPGRGTLALAAGSLALTGLSCLGAAAILRAARLKEAAP